MGLIKCSLSSRIDAFVLCPGREIPVGLYNTMTHCLKKLNIVKIHVFFFLTDEKICLSIQTILHCFEVEQ